MNSSLNESDKLMNLTGTGKPVKVCLLGASPEVQNMGVRALCCSFVKLVLEIEPDAEISLLYGTPTSGTHGLKIGEKEVNVQIVNCRWSPRSKLRDHLLWIILMSLIYRLIAVVPIRRKIRSAIPWIKTLVEADFIGNIHGGDSYSDIYGCRRFIFQAIENLPVIMLGKNLVFLPQTYGPFKYFHTRAIGRFFIRYSSRVFARDQQSLEFAREVLGHRNNGFLHFCPDVGFLLPERFPVDSDIHPHIPRERGFKLVGLGVSGLLYVDERTNDYTKDYDFGFQSDYKDLIHALIETFLNQTDAHLLLVPHVIGPGVESDSEANRKVWDLFKRRANGRIHLAVGNYDQSEVKGIIGQCDFFVGSRMHACIASLSQGIPSVGLSYSKKFVGVFQVADFQEMVLDLRELCLEEIVEACIRLYKGRTSLAKRLAQVIPGVQQQIYDSFMGFGDSVPAVSWNPQQTLVEKFTGRPE